MSDTPAPQTHAFQAEVAQLLHLVTHSLYSHREIFLRELISNASDACDKLRFEALSRPELYENQPELRVRLDFDPQARTLTIADTGIGMSQEEAIAHLGTIAKSGTREFMARLAQNPPAEGTSDGSAEGKTDARLIGQFGVGFYSGFIVADRITVESRRAGLPPEQGVRWSSRGAGDFETTPITQAERGTRVILHLKEDALEYAQGWRLRELIAQYADHIDLLIQMPAEQWQEGEGESQSGRMVKTGQWDTVNQATALWARPKKDITDTQYQEFYQHLTHDRQPPLAWSHHRVEGATEYTQLLYLPRHATHDLWDREHTRGIKLYVRRVFIMDDARQLLPRYLRFVQGVVDSADLPLNVSRELLQQSRDIKTLREGNTRRVLALLADLARDSDPSRYATFWQAFGPVLKEGLGEDPGQHERLLPLMRWPSTHSESASLADYKSRMQPGQKAIYYLTADTPAAAQSSPQLELFRRKGVEVLLMSDRVDEWAMNFVHEYDGAPLQSIARGGIDLGELLDENEKKAAQAATEAAAGLIERLKETLKDQAADVRATARLSDSPACLVSEGGMSLQMARLLKAAGQNAPEIKPVLEINPAHPLLQTLQASANDTAAPERFAELAHILFDQALLAEGQLPANPADYVRRVSAWLGRTATPPDA